MKSPTSINEFSIWLLPHCLGLDAVAVALVWQRLAASDCTSVLPWPERAALGLTVWCIYLTDRVRDGLHLNQNDEPRHRHIFAHKHRRFITGLIVLAFFLNIMVVVCFLPSYEIIAGLLLIAGVILYLVWTEFRGVFIQRGYTKEIIVGLLFACGVFLSEFMRTKFGVTMVLTMVKFFAFSALCTINCLTISLSEARIKALKTFWGAFGIVLAFQVVMACNLPDERHFFYPSICSGLLLGGLMWSSQRHSLAKFAFEADLALIVPASATFMI